MEREIQRLRQELERVTRERDDARQMCTLMQNCMELLQVSLGLRTSSGFTPHHWSIEDRANSETRGVPLTPSAPPEDLPEDAVPPRKVRLTSTDGMVPNRIVVDVSPRGGIESSAATATVSSASDQGGLHRPVTSQNAVTNQASTSKDPVPAGRAGEPSRARKPQGQFAIPSSNDIVILSDSLFRAIDHSFCSERNVLLLPISGLRIAEAKLILAEMRRRQTTAFTLILCVGTNDYYCSPLDVMKRDAEEVVKVASGLAGRVLLCTVPRSYWKGRKFSHVMFEHHQQTRRLLNVHLINLARQISNVDIFDLESLFKHHTGLPGEQGRGWYHRDAVHPNVAGSTAIEHCLRQVLTGKPVVHPAVGDSCLEYDDVDIEWRRSLLNMNYDRSQPLRALCLKRSRDQR